MTRRFRYGERVKISTGKLEGNEGVVVYYNSKDLVHITLDRRILLMNDGNERRVNKIAIQESSLESLELHDTQVEPEIIIDEPAPKQASTTQVLTFQDGFRIDEENKKVRYHGQSAEWKARGLCPKCGEKGRYSHSQAVCSEHGPY